MRTNVINITNWLIIIMTSGLSTFVAAALYLGSKVQYDELIKELPMSFFIRFGTVYIFGTILIILLVLTNWILNKTILKHRQTINLKRLFVSGLGIEFIACLIGCIIFFSN